MSDLSGFLRHLYWRLEDLIDPDTIDAHRVYADIVRTSTRAGSVWLDIGCGHSIFVPWLPSAANLVEQCGMVVGIDYDLGSLKKHDLIRNRIVGDLKQLPCGDQTFDQITANMVMEHVADPVEALQGVGRLLRPHGLFIFHTPNYWNYWTFLASLVPQSLKNKLIQFAEGRMEDDVFPTFYRLNTVSDITHTAQKAGFTVRELHRVSSCSTGLIFILGPFVILHLLWRRLTGYKLLENFRDNFVVILERQESHSTSLNVEEAAVGAD